MRIEKIEITGYPVAYRVIIEDIVIADEDDIAKCKQYEADNNHTAVKCVACGYAQNSVFVDSVVELLALEETPITGDNEDRRQCLIRFIGRHFTISYIPNK